MAFVGWIGVAFGLAVGPAQLLRILRTRETKGISLATYTFLCCALVCYLIHAIHIQDPVFITAQSINVCVNGLVLFLLIKLRKGK